MNTNNFLKYIQKWSTRFIPLNIVNPRHYCVTLYCDVTCLQILSFEFHFMKKKKTMYVFRIRVMFVLYKFAVIHVPVSVTSRALKSPNGNVQQTHLNNLTREAVGEFSPTVLYSFCFAPPKATNPDVCFVAPRYLPESDCIYHFPIDLEH